jgi:hypothetical protein
MSKPVKVKTARNTRKDRARELARAEVTHVGEVTEAPVVEQKVSPIVYFVCENVYRELPRELFQSYEMGTRRVTTHCVSEIIQRKFSDEEDNGESRDMPIRVVGSVTDFNHIMDYLAIASHYTPVYILPDLAAVFDEKFLAWIECVLNDTHVAHTTYAVNTIHTTNATNVTHTIKKLRADISRLYSVLTMMTQLGLVGMRTQVYDYICCRIKSINIEDIESAVVPSHGIPYDLIERFVR